MNRTDREYTEGNRGAINALRGYRLQALYSIHRVLNSEGLDLKFIPEGIEDLDIVNDQNELVQLIQVKSTQGSLVLSDLVSTKGSSFFGRAIDCFDSGKKPKLEVVCFGDIGKELKQLFSGGVSSQDFKNRFQKYGWDQDQLNYIQDNTELISLIEEDCHKDVINLIQKKALAVDPNIAIDILHNWLFNLSEMGGIITVDRFLAKLNDVGVFVNERAKFHEHLHSTIRRISSLYIDDLLHNQLAKGYYEGTAARFEHIVADLDVPRNEKIVDIRNRFRDNNIVIVHGASGQGKSSLAYRYVHEFHSELAYEIVVLPNLSETLMQIQALNSLSKSLEIPIILYIDVPPGNLNWIQILKDFAFNDSFKFLVTIREEDWNRTPEKGVSFSFSDLELRFTSNEAKLIYDGLNEIIPDKKFTDFEEAWLLFGGEGPLLEFTHLITQGATLEARIKGQLDRLEKEDAEYIKLLKVVCLADLHGAKVLMTNLRNGLFSKLRLIINSLEKEYLLRTSEDEKCIVGLHPIRSEIIVKLIHDDAEDINATIDQCIELIGEQDLYLFLNGIFREYPEVREPLTIRLEEKDWRTYEAYANVCDAMLYLGTIEFIQTHRTLLDDLYSFDSFLFHLRTHLDFTQSLSNSKFFEDNLKYQKTVEEYEQRFNHEGIAREEILSPLIRWIEKVNINIELTAFDSELEAAGKLLFWNSYLGTGMAVKYTSEEIKAVVEPCSLRSVSRLLFGLHNHNDDTRALALEIEGAFLEKLQRQYKIPVVNRTKDSIQVHFILDLYSDFNHENAAHFRKLEIIHLLRYGTPYLKKHGAKGYGHKLSFLPDNIDSSEGNIPIENNPIDYLVQMNSLLFNLFLFDKRPSSWTAFVVRVLDTRKEVLLYWEDLIQSLEKYYKQGRNRSTLLEFAVNELVDVRFEIDYGILFPQQVSDITGVISESSSRFELMDELNKESQSLLLSKFKGFKKEHDGLFQSISNFNNQSIRVIMDDSNLTIDKKKNLLRVSLVNLMEAGKKMDQFQKSFRDYFGKYVDDSDLQIIETKERSAINSLVYGWKHYVSKTKQQRKLLSKESERNFKKIKLDFEKRLKKECDRIKEESYSLFELTPHFDVVPGALVIVLDFTSPLDTYSALEYGLMAVNNAIGSCNHTSLKKFVLEKNYNEFWFVPSFFSQVLLLQCYKIPLYQFTVFGINNISPYQFIPKELDEAAVNDLGLIMAPDDKGKIRLAQSIITNFQELLINLKVAIDLFALDEEVNPLGDEILQSKIQIALDKAGGLYSQLSDDIMIEANRFVDADLSVLEQEELNYCSLVIDCMKLISPVSEGTEHSKISLSLKEVKKWKESLEANQNLIMEFYFTILERVVLMVEYDT